ncbi:hypothetical protein LI073_02720 [bacterium 210917-SL.2.15]|nr:hypothetical protein [bacterium 210917-SL.2.15]MCB7512940.1 hypothetical protein [bacterium 210917-SL.2.15]
MKKIISFLLAGALVLSLAACSGGESNDTLNGDESNKTSDAMSGDKPDLKIGDIASAGDWDFTLIDVEFNDAMADENNGLYYLRPADDEYKSAAGNSFYTAESGNVFLFFTAELSYNGKETAELGSQSENSIGFEIRYGDGYTFDTYEFVIADAQGADGSNLYTYDSVFEPLDSGRECRGYFEVPLEVQNSETDFLALAVTFMDIDGAKTELVYDIR